MITNIRAVDRQGTERQFVVCEEAIVVRKYKGIRYKIRTETMSPSKHFSADMLFISEDRILQYLLVNNNDPEVSEKGIVKALLKAVSNDLKKDIVSSTDIGTKTIEDEGSVSSP